MNGIWIKYQNGPFKGLILARGFFASGPVLNAIVDDTEDDSGLIPIGCYNTKIRAEAVLDELCSFVKRGQAYFEIPKE
jgi:hypothetical protein